LTIIHRLQTNLAKNNFLRKDSQSMSITFSAGIALRSFGEHQNSVISRADKALYQAKHTGKNRAIPALT
ncbi:MAG: diguanylate cyclase, partial [Pseudomonadota bacterium]